MPRKNWAGAVLVFAAGFLLPFFFSVVPAGTPSTIYANAMADTPLALLFGGTLCLYAAAGGRKTGFFACAMPLAVLTMTKDIGFAYALIVTFLIGWISCSVRRTRIQSRPAFSAYRWQNAVFWRRWCWRCLSAGTAIPPP